MVWFLLDERRRSLKPNQRQSASGDKFFMEKDSDIFLFLGSLRNMSWAVFWWRDLSQVTFGYSNIPMAYQDSVAIGWNVTWISSFLLPLPKTVGQQFVERSGRKKKGKYSSVIGCWFLASPEIDSPGRYQQLDLFIKVLRLLCPNLTDAKSFLCPLPLRLFDLEFVC